MSELVSNPIRLLLIDGHTLVRAGLRALLADNPNLVIVGEAANCVDALLLAEQAQANVILFDPQLIEPGNDLIPQLLAIVPQARIVLLTGLFDSELEQAAVHAGAIGIVRTDQSLDFLIRAIEKVNAGEAWLDHATVANVLTKIAGQKVAKEADPEEAKIAKLSARELDIISLAGEGLRNKDIGERLAISEVTVRHYFTAIFSKLEIADRLELIIFAYRHGLAQPPR